MLFKGLMLISRGQWCRAVAPLFIYLSSSQSNFTIMEPKFKAGDTIVPIIPHTGIECGTVTRVGMSNYHLRVMCGTAIIPISSQDNYKLKEE